MQLRKILDEIVLMSFKAYKVKVRLGLNRLVRSGFRAEFAKKVILSDEQKKEIDEVFGKGYGRRLDYAWHRYYQSYTGHYDKYYLPEAIHVQFQMHMVDKAYAKALTDKSIMPLLLADVEGLHIPATYVTCTNGLYRDSHNQIISQEQAEELLANAGPVFVKPTVDSSSGRNCQICDFVDGVDTNTRKSVRGGALRLWQELYLPRAC